jgi:hypothetical protein
MWNMNWVRNNANINLGIVGGYWSNTTDNITSISIYNPIENGFAVGSYIELWKLAQ